MKQALLISAHPEEQDYIRFALRHDGLNVTATLGTEPGLAQIKDRSFDVIVLSTGDENLVEFVKEIRLTARAPLLIVSGLLTDNQHCDYLDAGVDCVLQQPMSLRTFTRYVRIMLRRSSAVPSTVLQQLSSEVIKLNPSNRTVVVAGRDPVRLTQLEFRLLYVLMANKDQVVPTEELVERVWGYHGDGSRDLVRGLVRRLRKKIEPTSDVPQFVHNLPGVGYQFSAETVPPSE